VNNADAWIFSNPVASEHATLRRGRAINTSASYLGGSGFKSRPGDRLLSWVSRGFPQSFQAKLAEVAIVQIIILPLVLLWKWPVTFLDLRKIKWAVIRNSKEEICNLYRSSTVVRKIKYRKVKISWNKGESKRIDDETSWGRPPERWEGNIRITLR
jgi:hypothetical protein